MRGRPSCPSKRGDNCNVTQNQSYRELISYSCSCGDMTGIQGTVTEEEKTMKISIAIQAAGPKGQFPRQKNAG